ncbi:unnamed protein product [Cylicostephanus goldi]|uniref:ATP-dependent DNA helicase n=1 Tax=Cylicostephanus goldi TaxID=71465 RepID=A0A3P6PKN1_CYLGO|nr:unnamed protein product [Cylicostephanus goldi]
MPTSRLLAYFNLVNNDEHAKLPKGQGNKLYYIDGKAGCGKTYTLNALIQLLEADGKKVLSTASTGIAATLLKHGRTAHSLFCLPIKRLHELNASRYALECVERLLRDVAAPSLAHALFGGVTIILGGDWCQFLPVIQGGTRQETLDTTCKSSHLWKHFITFMLDENLRLDKSEIDYARWLLFVGAGKNYCDDENILLPLSMCMTNEDDIINWIYTPEVLADSSMLAKVALLTVRNCDVEELNIKVLKKLPGTALYLTGIDTPSVEEDGLSGLPCDNEEYFHKLMPAALPPHSLRIKIGSIIMLLRNLDVTAQLCNGTRLILLSILNDGKLLVCKNLINGKIAFIQRMNLDYTNEKTGISFRRLQFPIRLAFCMTINKSQGQTFDKVGVILRTPSFAHGSTYVALSRCTTSHGIKVTRNWSDAVPLAPKIRNVVYDEITNS